MNPPPNNASARAWLERLERSPHALTLLFLASMAETLVVPIPIELVLIPWMLWHPERKWAIAGVALAGNLAAASIGYGLGAFAMERWGPALLGWFGDPTVYEELVERFEEDGFMTVVSIAVVPIPFQLAMLASGAAGYPFLLFLLAALIGRGVRYFGLALLIAIAGEAAMRLWQRYSVPIGLAGLAAFGAWVWVELDA